MGKVLVSMPDDLLEEVDREAAARGTSRSGFLQQAVRRELEHSKVVIQEHSCVDAGTEHRRGA
jgi:metal-responsive CopG/Arc/MetJ family transcriptional regulator